MAQSNLFSSTLPALLVLLAIVIVGGCLIFGLRRWMRSNAPTGEGFTLHDLRQLRARGELSEEEFENARRAIVDRVRAVGSDNGGPSEDASE